MDDESKQESIENQTKGQIRKVFCLNCKNSTRHLVTVSLDKDGAAWNSYKS